MFYLLQTFCTVWFCAQDLLHAAPYGDLLALATFSAKSLQVPDPRNLAAPYEVLPLHAQICSGLRMRNSLIAATACTSLFYTAHLVPADLHRRYHHRRRGGP